MASAYWIKLYHEILHDPKMCRLSDHLYRRCIELFLQAGETDKEGELPSVEDMTWTFRTTEESLLADLVELSKVGVLTLKGDRWIVTHFADRQDPITPAEGMARLRDRRHKTEYYEPTREETKEKPIQEAVVPSQLTNIPSEEIVSEPLRILTQIRLDTDKIRIDRDVDIDSAAPTHPNPRPSSRIREPVPINAALQAYFDVMQVRPNREQAVVITATITPSTIDKWKDVLRAWKQHDYKAGNVPGMLDWYQNGIPTNGHGKPQARAAPDPVIDVAEAIRLNELGRMQIP